MRHTILRARIDPMNVTTSVRWLILFALILALIIRANVALLDDRLADGERYLTAIIVATGVLFLTQDMRATTMWHRTLQTVAAIAALVAALSTEALSPWPVVFVLAATLISWSSFQRGDHRAAVWAEIAPGLEDRLALFSAPTGEGAPPHAQTILRTLAAEFDAYLLGGCRVLRPRLLARRFRSTTVRFEELPEGPVAVIAFLPHDPDELVVWAVVDLRHANPVDPASRRRLRIIEVGPDPQAAAGELTLKRFGGAGELQVRLEEHEGVLLIHLDSGEATAAAVTALERDLRTAYGVSAKVVVHRSWQRPQ